MHTCVQMECVVRACVLGCVFIEGLCTQWMCVFVEGLCAESMCMCGMLYDVCEESVYVHACVFVFVCV